MQYWRRDIDYNIYITSEAKTMLDKHFNFLGRVSINAVIKLKKTIKEYLIILKHFPKIGKILYGSKLPLQYRILVVHKRYILIYYIVKNNIYIKTILDSRQNNIYYLF